MQQWFAGSRRPDQRYHGEKTEPMKAMMEIARRPSSDTPSTYHQA
ncbi:MAG: hypothetical protein AAFU55_15885 [Pseudomonadota bacterium]